MIKVLIVDDHALFRKGIKGSLEGHEEFRIIGEARDGLESLQKARQLNPDIILMDLNMPRLGGLAAIRELQKELPSIKILVLTVSEKEADLFAAVKAGASGYMLKDVEPRKLIEAIELVSQGEAAFSPSLAHKILDEFSGGTAVAREAPEETSLTAREKEIIDLVAAGKSNREIAESLFISENTVKTHLKNTLEKLHMHNRAQAAAYVSRLGLNE